jgi:hypothetical protein
MPDMDAIKEAKEFYTDIFQSEYPTAMILALKSVICLPAA